jgi:hypothetical protein
MAAPVEIAPMPKVVIIGSFFDLLAEFRECDRMDGRSLLSGLVTRDVFFAKRPETFTHFGDRRGELVDDLCD